MNCQLSQLYAALLMFRFFMFMLLLLLMLLACRHAIAMPLLAAD